MKEFKHCVLTAITNDVVAIAKEYRALTSTSLTRSLISAHDMINGPITHEDSSGLVRYKYTLNEFKNIKLDVVIEEVESAHERGYREYQEFLALIKQGAEGNVEVALHCTVTKRPDGYVPWTARQ